MTNTQKNKLEKALNHIKNCSGNCKNCSKCKIIVSKKALCYAFVCSVHGMADYFSAISDSTKTLKNDMIEAIEFEVS